MMNVLNAVQLLNMKQVLSRPVVVPPVAVIHTTVCRGLQCLVYLNTILFARYEEVSQLKKTTIKTLESGE